MPENQSHNLAHELVEALKRKKCTLSLAESCTGGMVSAAITSISGASAVFDRGFITYSNDAKVQMLGVKWQTLDEFGAVSEETAKEMAAGALKGSSTDFGVSITGIAGPDGGTDEKPVGTVCFALAQIDRPVKSYTKHFSGDREDVRVQSTGFILDTLLKEIDLND